MYKKGVSPFKEPTERLRESDPEEVASRTGSSWNPVDGKPGEGKLLVPVLGGGITVGYPDISVEADAGLGGVILKLLTLLYLCNSDGTLPSGSWLAYRDVPAARFYEPVFARSVEKPLALAFGSAPEDFTGAAVDYGGKFESFGDASCSFELFPLVKICFIIWGSDEEFSARARVLFDENCGNHLDAFNLCMGAQEITQRVIGEASC